MTDQTEPIRRSELPPIPPPEWEFHTWFPHPDGGGDMVPGQRQRGVLVRRCVSYGDWEPVRPDRWADEPETDVRAVSSAGPAPATDPDTLRQPAYDAVFAYIRQQPRDFVPSTIVDRNAMIWRAVHAALDAVPPAPTDRATLRERIVQVLRTTPSALGAENPQLGFPSHHQPGESGYLGWCALCVRDIDAIADAVVVAVLPAPADRAAVLSPIERRMLEYALNLADAEIEHDDHGISDDEQDALAELRRMAGEAQQAPADRDAVLREAAAAIQAAIDADRARFPRRSNDRAALGAAREIVLNLIDESSRCTDTAPQDDYEATTGHAITCGAGFGMGCQCDRDESHRLGEQKIREAARWLRADVAFRVLDALDGVQRPASVAQQDPTQDGTVLAAENEALWGELHRRDTETDQPHPVARPGQPETDNAPADTAQQPKEA